MRRKNALQIQLVLLVVLGTVPGELNADVASPAPPVLKAPVLEGAIRIEGNYAALTEGDGKAKDSIELFVNGAKTDVEKVETSAEKGTFTLTLKEPAVRGQRLRVRYVRDIGKGDENPASQKSNEVTVEPTAYDWGRVQALFTFGGILSQKADPLNGQTRTDFSKMDPYLDFTLNTTWRMPEKPDSFLPTASGQTKQVPFHWMFSTFVNARLTSFPAPAQPEGGNSNNGGNDLPAFLQSRKGAQLSFGAYAPIYTKSFLWKFGGDWNSVFFAPLAKFGFQTITEEVKTQRNDPDDLFDNYSGGLRFGHFKLPVDNNTAPELLSYLDITYGKWENFEKCQKNGAQFATLAACQDSGLPRVNKNRLGFEGRLKIPKTPLVVGFDVLSGRDEDDVRFLFGANFDIGSLFGKLGAVRGSK